MKLFSAKNKSKADEIVLTSLSKANFHPFMELENYNPFQRKQNELYSSLREAVPIIDAAINKLIRLIGTFKVVCDDKNATKKLNGFLKNVKVNCGSVGINQFISNYFDSLLTYGTAVGEIVLSKDKDTVNALYNASLDDLKLEVGDSPLSMNVFVRNLDSSYKKVEHKELICVSLLNPEDSKPVGRSILKGLPFVSTILLKIFNTIGVNFERVGNVRFAVTYKPPENAHISSKQRVQEIATQWSKAMRDKSQVCDFVSVGDVSVKVIGADSQVLSCDIEIRHLLEQIVAKLSVPPFMLGLSWSSTERMSSQQADILTSELEFYRTLINPVIYKICRYFLRLSGLCDEFDIVWSNINLQDETELANSRLQNAQAAQIENTLTEVKS